MKKKKILFTAMSLNIGGAEKSLVNLLNLIDFTKYDVDLLLFQKKGPFLKQVPSEVKLIDIQEINLLFNKGNYNNVSSFKYIYFKTIRLFFTLFERVKWKQFDQVRLHRWIDKYQKMIPQNKTIYDVGISYAGGETAYYLIDKVRAKKKVYYFHSDYSKIDIDANLESVYVEKADTIITISTACKESLEKLFPKSKDKIKVLQNITSPMLIKKLSEEFYPEEYSRDKEYNILSIGRLNPIKGYDMAIEAAKILKEKKFPFCWYVVGEGTERKKLEKLIKKYDLQHNFKLIGLRENPYPYLLNCDLLVQPSRFEGKSLVLDEAKILEKPIVATNYNSVYDQINNNFNGLIVEMNSKSIADGIEMILSNKKKLKEIIENIRKEQQVTDNIEEYLSVILNEEK